MKKIVSFAAALLLGFVAAWAQDARNQAPSHAKHFYVAIQGGPVFNLYENAFTFNEQRRMLDLFTLQGAAVVGYDFTEAYGLRLQAAFGNDRGACNSRETSGSGFYPYSFLHANAFVDGVLNLAGLNGKASAFRPKLYAGVGGAYTFGFSESGHPWQKVTPANLVFGFRGGLIGEYCWKSGLGIYADLCGEAYLDDYNGLKPSKEDQEKAKGYAGFPLDLRGIFSLGVVYHF